MKKYLAMFQIRFTHGIQYRIVVFSHVFLGFLWGMMLVLAYTAFYRTDPASFPMTLSETVSYMWMQQTLLLLFTVVFSDPETENSIVSGTVAYDLVRPVDLYFRWFANSCANRAALTGLRLPILIIVFFLPSLYRISAPVGIWSFAAFLVSLVFALCVTTAFTMLMYVSMFYIISFGGIRVFLIASTSFLSGAVIPFPFLPSGVRKVLEILPFGAMQNIPLRIYSGNIEGIDILKGLAFQAVWLVLLVFIGKLAMNRSLKRVLIQGG